MKSTPGSDDKDRMERRMLPYLALIIAAAAITYLSLQLRELVEERNRLAERIRWPHAGSAVPTATVVSLEGDSLEIGRTAGGHHQLLYLFSPGCAHCRSSYPAVRQLFRKVQGDHPNVWGYALSAAPRDSLRAYRSSRPLPAPTAPFDSPKLTELYGGTHVPLLMLLDDRGYILYSRLGALSEASVDTVLTVVRRATASPATTGRHPPRDNGGAAPRVARRRVIVPPFVTRSPSLTTGGLPCDASFLRLLASSSDSLLSSVAFT